MKFLTDMYLIIECKINGQIKTLKYSVKNTYDASNQILKNLINQYNDIKIISTHWEY